METFVITPTSLERTIIAARSGLMWEGLILEMTHTTVQKKVLLAFFLCYRTYRNYVIISRYWSNNYLPDNYCAPLMFLH